VSLSELLRNVSFPAGLGPEKPGRLAESLCESGCHGGKSVFASGDVDAQIDNEANIPTNLGELGEPCGEVHERWHRIEPRVSLSSVNESTSG
jgi:hypothetical protein